MTVPILLNGGVLRVTVWLKEYELFYAAIPKTACTSIKHMFFQIENDRAYAPMNVNGKTKYIHQVYPSLLFEKHPKEVSDFRKLTIIRDPIKRIISTYGNRVVHHQEISPSKSAWHLKGKGLKHDPSLSEFIDNLDEYRVIPSINHHVRPIVDFIGTEPGYFDRVYAFNELSDFVADISAIVGKKLTLPRAQTGGPKLSPEDLSAEQIEKIRAYYWQDYEAYGAFF